jgi:hypothetical protein
MVSKVAFCDLRKAGSLGSQIVTLKKML